MTVGTLTNLMSTHQHFTRPHRRARGVLAFPAGSIAVYYEEMGKAIARALTIKALSSRRYP